MMLNTAKILFTFFLLYICGFVFSDQKSYFRVLQSGVYAFVNHPPFVWAFFTSPVSGEMMRSAGYLALSWWIRHIISVIHHLVN
jgi:protein-S-isoprenylcysteine O-methyltransferase Ste14